MLAVSPNDDSVPSIKVLDIGDEGVDIGERLEALGGEQAIGAEAITGD